MFNFLLITHGRNENMLPDKNKNYTGSLIKDIKRDKWIYALALIVVAYYVLFQYLPMYGAIIAFKEYDVVKGIAGSPWVGLKHFKDFINDYYFVRIMRNTFLLSVFNLLWSFPLTVIFALLLNEIKQQRFKKVVQTATYLPHFISTIVICGMLIDFLAEDGMISQCIKALGGEAKFYLNYPQYFRTIYITSGIWQSIGWGSIIYLAALSGIDTQLYEAAMIDGAGRLRQTWNITLPGILPTIVTLLILDIGKLMNLGYEKIILLYNGNTYETADVISTYVYRLGLGEMRRYSYTSAIGLFNSAINMMLLVSANHISKKLTETSLW